MRMAAAQVVVAVFRDGTWVLRTEGLERARQAPAKRRVTDERVPIQI